MARVLVLWRRPASLSRAETAAWLCTEAERLMVATSIGDVQIVSVAAYAPEQADYFDGMPELRVRPDGAVPDPAVAELLADFGALGMSPVALLAPDPP